MAGRGDGSGDLRGRGDGWRQGRRRVREAEREMNIRNARVSGDRGRREAAEKPLQGRGRRGGGWWEVGPNLGLRAGSAIGACPRRRGSRMRRRLQPEGDVTETTWIQAGSDHGE
ncbi:hypothetical protein chiPu_0023070, partial [Chiloscyllium punctatum]|nr:hypothetical protein [Chiloscyllium punctatum]